MKKNLLYTFLLALALSVSSCLDKYPENAILADDAITTIDEADQAVIGIYSSFLSGALYSGYLDGFGLCCKWLYEYIWRYLEME